MILLKCNEMPSKLSCLVTVWISWWCGLCSKSLQNRGSRRGVSDITSKLLGDQNERRLWRSNRFVWSKEVLSTWWISRSSAAFNASLRTSSITPCVSDVKGMQPQIAVEAEQEVQVLAKDGAKWPIGSYSNGRVSKKSIIVCPRCVAAEQWSREIQGRENRVRKTIESQFARRSRSKYGHDRYNGHEQSESEFREIWMVSMHPGKSGCPVCSDSATRLTYEYEPGSCHTATSEYYRTFSDSIYILPSILPDFSRSLSEWFLVVFRQWQSDSGQ